MPADFGSPRGFSWITITINTPEPFRTKKPLARSSLSPLTKEKAGRPMPGSSFTTAPLPTNSLRESAKIIGALEPTPWISTIMVTEPPGSLYVQAGPSSVRDGLPPITAAASSEVMIGQLDLNCARAISLVKAIAKSRLHNNTWEQIRCIIPPSLDDTHPVSSRAATILELRSVVRCASLRRYQHESYQA